MAQSFRDEGFSLWLIPPESSALFKAMKELIESSIPSLFQESLAPQFSPHVTLTAGTIDPESIPKDPQHWIDNLELSPNAETVRVKINDIHVGNIFFQKLILLCEKSHELCELALFCRTLRIDDRDSALAWVEESYGPHCSLM